jgi:hypothetical protein
MAVRFIGGGNRSKKITYLPQVTDKLYHMARFLFKQSANASFSLERKSKNK